MKARGGQFIRGSVLSFGALLLSFGFALLTSVVIARVLGTEGKGAYSVALRIAGVLAALAQWGVPEVLLGYVNRPEHPARRLAGTTQVLALGSGLLAFAAAPALYWAFSQSAFRGVELPMVALAAASTAFSLSFQFSSRVIQLQGDLLAYNALVVLRAGALLAFTLIVLSPGGEPIILALYAYLAAELLAAMVSARSLLRRSGSPWSVDWRLGVSMARSGNAVQLGMVAAFLAAEIGVFIVNSLLDLESVGWYTTGLGLARWTLFVSMATRVALQSELARFAGEQDQVARTTALVCRHTLLWLVAAALGLAVTGQVAIVLLYGESFLPSYAPLVVALPGVVAHGITQLLSGYFVSVGRYGLPSVVAWFNLVSASVLQVLLIPVFGITGASAGLSVTYIGGALLIAILYTRHSGATKLALLPGWAELAWYRAYLRTLVRRG